MIQLLTLLLASHLAAAIDLDDDPRLACENNLAITKPLLDSLVDQGVLSVLEAEHCAVVPGRLIEGPRDARVFHDVSVLVKPDGDAMVFGPSQVGTIVLLAPRPDRRVDVPAFANQMRYARAGDWYWRRPTVARLTLGDVPKAEFLDRAEAAVRELMRVNVLSLDGVRLGHVYRGTYRLRSYDVLYWPSETDEGDHIAVFDAGTGAHAELKPDVELREFLFLKDGSRIGRRDGRWVSLPPIGWMHDPAQVGRDRALRGFVATHPAAMDDLLFRAVEIQNVNFSSSEVRAAVDEVSGENFFLLTARDAYDETTHHFLYDPVAEAWIDESDFGPRTLRLPGGARLGVNLPGAVYQWLAYEGEFERLRALFTRR